MKNLLLLVTLCLFSVISRAATYYVATTGSDSNPGTITSPFKTIGKLNSVMNAGDIAYIRGGTYQSTAGNGANVHFGIENLNGTASNPIKIWTYPGETVILDCSNITPTYENPIAMWISNCNYVYLKGKMIVKNLKQVASGNGVSRGFALAYSNNCTIEFIEIYNMGGTGFILDHANNNLIKNSDSHHCGDGLSSSQWDFSDGFTSTGGDLSSDNTFDGCRSWLNSDDGWDFFAWAGSKVTIKNCWSFWQGIKPWGPSGTQVNEAGMTPEDPAVFFNNSSYMSSTSSGEGFKLGGYNAGGPGPAAAPNTTKKFLNNCVSFQNTGTGYAANMDAQYSHRMQLYNCVAYGNGNDGFGFGTGRSVGIAMIFKNCYAYGNNKIQSGADWVYDGLPDNISNNYWESTYMGVNYGNLKSPLSITNADFLSTSSVGASGARQPDGSLPVLNYLKLASSSDLVDKGVNIGLSFMGTSPDLGAYESTGTSSNINPTVNAGTDITITLPINSVTFNGSGTDPDGTISSYAWTKVSGPTGGTITTASSASTTITGLEQGAYVFQLKVTDNGGATNTDIIQVIVNAAVVNTPPTANAGVDKTITLPTNSVSITGTGTDPGGSISAYLWTKISGPTGGTIATATSATTSISALIVGVYKFELKVTDNAGATAKDTMQVTVNAAGNVAPTANAGADKTVVLPTSTSSLTGTGTDSDGTIAAYTWTKVSGPTGGTIATATAATTAISALIAGVYKFELKVTDNAGATGRDTVQVTVSTVLNPAPVANAGADKTITLPTNSVSLTGSGTDANGTIASYAWTKVSGPIGSTITTATIASTTVTVFTAGVYKFELKVTDNGGAIGRDTIQVTVNAVVTPTTAYGGVRWAIPGTVQAENFDNGGQNVAYYDLSASNYGNYYRTADYVDLQASSENSPNVGWNLAGEWMKYSVNVTTTGTYTLSARVAGAQTGKSFRVEMDGTVIATVNVPNTGSTQTWQTVSIPNISLTAGNKTMRIYSVTDSYNINYVTFTSTATARTDGTDSTTAVISENEADTKTTVTTFPLPFSTSFTLNIYGEMKGDYNLMLVNMSGNTVWKKTVTKNSQTLTENIYMGNLPAGVYILQVVTPDQKKSSHQLIKN